MAGSVANSRKALTSGQNTTTTSSFTSTAGNTIWVGVSDASGQGSLTISDNKGNTYTQIGTTQTNASGSQLRRYYCANIAGGSGHTVTATWGSNSDAVVAVLELAGVQSSPLDVSSQGADANPPWTTTTPTLSQADSVAVSMASGATNGTWSESSGFTIDQQEGNSSLYWTAAAGSRVVSATTALTPSWTISGGGSDASVSCDVFKAAAAGGNSVAPGAGSVVITGYAPGISQPHSATPGAGAITLTGFAPTVGQPHSAAPSAGALALTGYAPTIAQPHSAAPGAGAMAITGYAPTVTQSGAQTVAPGAGAMVLTGYAPTVTQGSPAPGAAGKGFEMGGRRIAERNFKPLLQRVLERRYPRVKPAKERAARRAKAIEQTAAQLVADDPQNLARFDALMQQWMAERPVAPPGLDLSALFEAQVGFRLRQLQLEQQARQALADAQARDEEDALALLLLLS